MLIIRFIFWFEGPGRISFTNVPLHTVSWTLYFSYGVRHLTSAQSLMRGPHATWLRSVAVLFLITLPWDEKGSVITNNAATARSHGCGTAVYILLYMDINTDRGYWSICFHRAASTSGFETPQFHTSCVKSMNWIELFQYASHKSSNHLFNFLPSSVIRCIVSPVCWGV